MATTHKITFTYIGCKKDANNIKSVHSFLFKIQISNEHKHKDKKTIMIKTE